MAKVSMRDNKKRKRTSRNNTGCVTTRCCIECPRPSTRKRRRKLASRSRPLSRAMPMPLGSLMNIMPSPMMPLNIPLPRVEANRRPFGTYQFNNQPVRVQQDEGRKLGTIRDSQARGVTNQNLPITNPPRRVPPSRLSRKETPPNPFIDLPNELDLQGFNAEAVSNQGQNLRQNRGVEVAADEIVTNLGSYQAIRDTYGSNIRGLSTELGIPLKKASEILETPLTPSMRRGRPRVISRTGEPLLRSKDEELNLAFGAGAGLPPTQRIASDDSFDETDRELADTAGNEFAYV